MNRTEAAGRPYSSGVAAMKEGKSDIAEMELREALRIDPDFAEALRDIGWLLYGKDRQEEALLYLEKARSLDDSLEYLHMYLGLVLAELKRTNEAEQSFKRALKDPSYPALAHALYANYLAVTRQNQEAEAHFLAALSLDGSLLIAHRNYARFLESMGRNQEAEHYFRRALKLDPEDAPTKKHWNEFSIRQARNGIDT